MSAPGPPLLEEDEDDAFFGEEVVVFFAGLAAAAAGFLEASFASFAFSSSDLFWGGATMRLVFLSASPLIPLFGLASIPEIPLELLRSSSTYASCEEAVSDLADGPKMTGLLEDWRTAVRMRELLSSPFAARKCKCAPLKHECFR